MAILLMRGRVWKFGDNISTDYMMPGFTTGTTAQERASYCMRSIRPEFASRVKKGDIIIAGKNFGCGSSRAASINLMELGISCAIAKSFGRIFFRNSINLGFPVLYCPEAYDSFNEGEEIEINFNTGEIRNVTTGKLLKAEPLPEIAQKILNAGGVVAMLQSEYGTSKKVVNFNLNED